MWAGTSAFTFRGGALPWSNQSEIIKEKDSNNATNDLQLYCYIAKYYQKLGFTNWGLAVVAAKIDVK